MSDHVMTNQYADSESSVNAEAGVEFRITLPTRSNDSDMATAKEDDDPVTPYVRHLLKERDDAKLPQKELAERAGFADGKWSMIAQIKNGTSRVTFVTVKRLARAFGTDPLTLHARAIAWKEGRPLDGATVTAQAEAIGFALDHGVTKEQIDRAVRRYPVAEVGEQDAMWWLAKFHEERTLSAKIAGAERALERHEAWEEKTTRKHGQSDWRARRKPKDPPVAAEPARPKARRRAS